MLENRPQRNPFVFGSLAIGLIGLLWAFWGSFVAMSVEWERKPEYSHGYLVPLIALALLWFRHEQLQMGRPRMSRSAMAAFAAGLIALFALPASLSANWGFLFAGIALIGAGFCLRPEKLEEGRFQPSWWGLPLLVGGIALRLFAAYYYIEWFDQLSLIPCVLGIVLLTVGWPAIRWSWPAILFLGFMVPLPHTLEGMLRSPLRKVGTKASTYLMQTCGLPAFADGNQYEIMVGGTMHRIGVTEACSGLSMLMIFFAISTAVALVIRRPIWDKLVILLSAVPIALIANVLRITLTGMMLYALEGEDVSISIGSWSLIDMPGSEFADSFFHDWAGWMMMPLALILMWGELAILKRVILIEDDIPLSVKYRKSEEESETTKKPSSEAGTTHSDQMAPASHNLLRG